MDSNQIVRTVYTLRKMAREYECSEFKHNNFNPDETGEYISALSNSAALMTEPAGFIIWGVDDLTYQIIGTTFSPHKEKYGNEELENWLSHHLNPRVEFKIHEVQVEGNL